MQQDELQTNNLGGMSAMLEVKNVCKTYKPKKGVPVKALDNVSLKFDDKGLVFILGKSGSGKSTLLNVVGGLDKADSGEFVIKGKSSKQFSGADFDAYRNTFIGFIFQEYNILNDFTVGANIALAMELQGKKATSHEINEILQQVDLVGYANRKPNELSGGQKQRVAIARALIKQPQIIMADEPTGALDSNTGKQVFETLKKLSKEKLVIVVSHDREFAEFYGDRVIELADGQVLSDIVKYKATATEKTDGVSIIEDKIVHIKKGYKLTTKDLDMINEYLQKQNEDIFISSDERGNRALRQASMIDDEGNKESFRKTEQNEFATKSYNKKDSKFIRAKLPFRKSLKIGASGLKAKPFRLFMTILLSLVAFALFGLADTISAYDKIENAFVSIRDNGDKSVVFEKRYKSESNDDVWYNSSSMGKNSLLLLNERTGMAFQGVYAGYENWSTIRYSNSLVNKKFGNGGNMSIYGEGARGLVSITEEQKNALGFHLEGRLPVADDEIVITKHIFDELNSAGFRDGDGNVVAAGTLLQSGDLTNGVLGKKIMLNFDANDYMFKVVGVLDTGFDYETYKDFDPYQEQTGSNNLEMDYMKSIAMSAYRDYGYHSLMFVNDGYVGRHIDALGLDEKIGTEIKNDMWLNVFTNQNEVYNGISFSSVASLEQMKNAGIKFLWKNGEKTALADNEIVVSFDHFKDNFVTFYGNLPKANDNRPGVYYTLEYVEGDYCRFVQSSDAQVTNIDYLRGITSGWNEYFAQEYAMNMTWDEMASNQNFLNFMSKYWSTRMSISDYDKNNPRDVQDLKTRFATYFNQDSCYDPNTEENYYGGRRYEADVFASKIFEIAQQESYSMSTYNMSYNIKGNYREESPVNIVGYYVSNEALRDQNGFATNYIVSDEIASLLSDSEPEYYVFAIAQMPDLTKLHQLVELGYRESEDIEFALLNLSTVTLNRVNNFIEPLVDIFLYVGIGFAVFAALMLMNFIMVSISYKKREIGILRAIGAKTSDVFKIFFNESAIIAFINFALAVVACFFVVGYLNTIIRVEYGFAVTLLNFTLRQVVLVFAVSFIAAFISSFVPVYRFSHKKPIDAIKER